MTFVAIEGIDASGKSTVARRLATRLGGDDGRRTLLLDRTSATASLSGYAADHLDALRRLIWEYPDGVRTSDLGFGHWAHLLAAWFNALDHLVVRPALAGGVCVIADSWVHKYAARFALTAGLASAERFFDGIHAPDVVLWLDVEPEVCSRRRLGQRTTEAGEWVGLDTDARGFVEYQGRVREVYARLGSARAWERVGVLDQEEVVDESCGRVRAWLERSGTAAPGSRG